MSVSVDELRELLAQERRAGARLQLRTGQDHKDGPCLLVGTDHRKRRTRIRGDEAFIARILRELLARPES